MRIYRHYEGLAADYLNGVIAIGNFDGVHRGHREVINEAGRIARDEGRWRWLCSPAVLPFHG